MSPSFFEDQLKVKCLVCKFPLDLNIPNRITFQNSYVSKEIKEWGPQEVVLNYEVCPHCGQFQCLQNVRQEVLTNRISRMSYDSFRKDIEIKTFTDDFRAKLLAGWAKQIGISLKDSLCVDIGTATCSFLYHLKKNVDCRVLGYDPIAQYADYAKKDLGVKLIGELFNTMTIEESSVDVVTIIQTMENIPTVNELCHDVWYSLKKGGLFYIETPDVWRLRRDDAHYYHPFIFSPLSLAQVLYKHGFEVVRWSPYGICGQQEYDHMSLLARKIEKPRDFKFSFIENRKHLESCVKKAEFVLQKNYNSTTFQKAMRKIEFSIRRFLNSGVLNRRQYEETVNQLVASVDFYVEFSKEDLQSMARRVLVRSKNCQAKTPLRQIFYQELVRFASEIRIFNEGIEKLRQNNDQAASVPGLLAKV